jgi:hypothetical protein
VLSSIIGESMRVTVYCLSQLMPARRKSVPSVEGGNVYSAVYLSCIVRARDS